VVDKIDPTTGERWRKIPRLHERPAFNWLTLLLWLAVATFLWSCLIKAMPLLAITPASYPSFQMAQALVMGKGFSLMGPDGHWWPMVTIPPVLPVVIALTMVFSHSTDITVITPLIQWLNLGLMLLATFLLHRLAGHYFKSPYPAVVALLFVVSPLAWHSIAQGTQYALFQVFALSAILMIDGAFKDAAGGTQPAPKQLFNIGSWLLLAVGTHPAGWALVVATSLMTLRWLGLRRWLITGLCAIVLLSPWWIRMGYVESVFRQQNPGYQAMQAQLHDYRLLPPANTKQGVERAKAWTSASGLSVLGISPDTTLNQLPMPPADRRRTALSAQVRHLADIISTLLARWWWVSLAVVLLTLWGALNLLLVRSGILGATVGLGALLSVALAPVTMQPGAALLYPALLLSGFKGLKGIGDSLAPSKVPILTAVVPLIVTAIVMGSVLQYLSLLHHGADWIATQPLAESTVAVAISPSATGPALASTTQQDSVVQLPKWFIQAPNASASGASPPSGVVAPLVKAPSPAAASTKDTAGYINWLANNTRRNDALVFHSPSRLHRATQRPVFDLPTAGRPAANVMLMNQAQFLVQDTQQPESANVVVPLIAQYPNRFRLAYTSAPEHVKIWQILPKATPATPASPVDVPVPTPPVPLPPSLSPQIVSSTASLPTSAVSSRSTPSVPDTSPPPTRPSVQTTPVPKASPLPSPVGKSVSTKPNAKKSTSLPFTLGEI
jgi:hypothetical protein